MKILLLLATLISPLMFSRTYFYWRDFKPDSYYLRFEVETENGTIDKVFHTSTNSVGVEDLSSDFSKYSVSLMLKKDGNYSTWSDPIEVTSSDLDSDKFYPKFRFFNVSWRQTNPY